MVPPVIVWFRDDLRLSDHPALTAAAASGRPLLAAHVRETGLGAAADWWLGRSLRALTRDLAALGVPLVRRSGDPAVILPTLAAEMGADTIHWNRRIDPAGETRDQAVAERCRERGLTHVVHRGSHLFDPETTLNANGTPPKVFTPFWRRRLAGPEPEAPLPAPTTLAPHSGALPASDPEPSEPAWAAGLAEAWTPGEAAARERLTAFLDEGAPGYSARRDRVDIDGTSRLSPRLRFGELSPRQVWRAARTRATADPTSAPGIEAFLRQIGWREFCLTLLHHHPHLVDRPLDPRFERFPWVDDPDAFAAWTEGRTGYPLVDAGMRQLWRTGWMHNRARMVAASFLVKDLLIPWTKGAAWFADTLVDHDPALNAANWQWVAGCGADAAPFFRIFNPTTQAIGFDPQGAYAEKYLTFEVGPPDRYEPRPTPPIVDHRAARLRALAALETTSRTPR